LLPPQLPVLKVWLVVPLVLQRQFGVSWLAAG
jgi:hypothetical protein